MEKKDKFEKNDKKISNYDFIINMMLKMSYFNAVTSTGVS